LERKKKKNLGGPPLKNFPGRKGGGIIKKKKGKVLRLTGKEKGKKKVEFPVHGPKRRRG